MIRELDWSVGVLRWYAIWVKRQKEDTVRAQLESKSFEVFLPRIPTIKIWSDRIKKANVLLFPGYLFVRIVPSWSAFSILSYTSGVIKVLGLSNEGCTHVPDYAIQSIKTLIDRQVEMQIVPFAAVGDLVKVAKGPFSGLVGTVVEKSGNHRLLISIHGIQQSLSVSIDSRDLVPFIGTDHCTSTPSTGYFISASIHEPANDH